MIIFAHEVNLMAKDSLSILRLFPLALGLMMCLTGLAPAQSKKNPIEAIRSADIKHDLFALAGDHFRGRATGTLDVLKASMWLAEEARKAGLEPAGDDGTFFPVFSLTRQRVSLHSTVQIGSRVCTLWKDVIVFEPIFPKVDAPIVFVTDPEAVTEEAFRTSRRESALVRPFWTMPAGDISLITQ